jgi:hypothetical protein
MPLRRAAVVFRESTATQLAGPGREPRLLRAAKTAFVSLRLWEQSVKNLERMPDA